MEWANRMDSDDDFEFEIVDTRGPATTTRRWPVWQAQLPRTQPSQSDQRLWQVARAAGVTVILAVALLRLLPSSITHLAFGGSSLESVDLLATEDDVACLVDAAWSPDGTRVAILGYQYGVGCPNRQFVPAQITVYALAPTTVVARIPVDGLLARALRPWSTERSPDVGSGKRPGTTRSPVISYYDLSWSRDGQSLATRFSVLYPGNQGGSFQTPHVGLMVLDSRGSHAHVIQLGYLESTELAPVWASEQAPEFGTIAPTPMNPYAHGTDTTVLNSAIALRPDGRVAASCTDAGLVDLVDTASGRKLTSLVPRVSSRFFSGRTALLRWSPDGTRLLLASGVLGSATVWWT